MKERPEKVEKKEREKRMMMKETQAKKKERRKKKRETKKKRKGYLKIDPKTMNLRNKSHRRRSVRTTEPLKKKEVITRDES